MPIIVKLTVFCWYGILCFYKFLNSSYLTWGHAFPTEWSSSFHKSLMGKSSGQCLLVIHVAVLSDINSFNIELKWVLMFYAVS